MSQAHLDELYASLTQRGWKVSERRRGDHDVEGAATWEIRRDPDGPALLIDFAGFGGMGEDIRLEESGCCEVRGQRLGLYFRRVNRSRERWLSELTEFVNALDAAMDQISRGEIP